MSEKDGPKTRPYIFREDMTMHVDEATGQVIATTSGSEVDAKMLVYASEFVSEGSDAEALAIIEEVIENVRERLGQKSP